MVYHINEYDWCVMKTIVNGNQCTIIWHVDYLKMLHFDSDIFSSIISDIDVEYGIIAKMTTTWGRIQKYLGMTID